nr:hypothetical protein [Tanacetum cinerariifolium]
MDPNTSIGHLCLGENDRISLNDKIESEGNWEGPEYQNTADSGRKKEVKSFTFHRMETEEVKKWKTCWVLIILKGELYFVIINDDSYDEIDALLASIDVDDLPPFEIIDMPPFVYKMGKSSRNKKKPSKNYKMSYNGKYDLYALVDIGSNINVMPYRIYENLGREKVNPLKHKITMLEHSRAEPMGRLLDVLYRVGVTTILASFLLLDIHVDRDVSIVVRRSFLHTCGAIMNTIKGTTSTFDGIVHQKFYVANVRNAHTKSDSNDDEEYCLKRDDMGKPIYGSSRAKYLSYDDLMDRALALQEALNPFKRICVWKKAIAFLGALPDLLQNVEWMPNRSGNFNKENGNGKWHTKIRVVDPYGDIF